jgi:hypothetical protein
VREDPQRDLAFGPIGGHERRRSWRPIGRAGQMQTHPPEVARVASRVAVAADLGERRAACRFQRTTALDRRGVKQDDIVGVSGRSLREHPDKPLDRLGQAPSPFVQSILRRQAGKQMPQLPLRRPQEAPIRRDPHQHLRDTERNDLRVGELSPCVRRPSGQEVVGRAVDTDQQQVEVGVHRGLLVNGVKDTADFDLPHLVPIATANAVASII